MIKNDKFNKCKKFGGQGYPPYGAVFLENEKDMIENLSELYNDTTKAKNYIARLNESGEKSKIELLNSLIKTIHKKQDLSEHILEAKFMLLKANLMAGQDKVCK